MKPVAQTLAESTKRGLTPANYSFSDPSTRTFSLGIAAARTVWTSGCTASKLDKPSGRILVQGDLAQQVRVAIEKIRLVVEAAGLNLQDIVALRQYVVVGALDQTDTILETYRDIFGGRPPFVNTIAVERLIRSRALIEIEAVARRSDKSALDYLAPVDGVSFEDARSRAAELLKVRGYGWHHVVRRTDFIKAGSTTIDASLRGKPGGLCVALSRLPNERANVEIQLTASRENSEVIFLSAEGDPSVGGVTEQCREIYERFRKLLEARGCSLKAIVKTTEYVHPDGMSDYKATADVRRALFAAPFPAATGVFCAHLGQPGALIAVEAIAVIEDKSGGG